MAIVRATKSGNWSDTTVWNTGALPTNADTVWANTYTVAIDMDLTGSNAVVSLNNSATTGVTLGGSFSVTIGAGSTRTITANIVGYGASVATLIHSGAGTLAVVGDVTGPSSGGGNSTISVTSTGTLTVTGAVNGGNNSSQAINCATAATITVTGNVTGGAGTSSGANGITISGGATLTVNGNVTGGSSSQGGTSHYGINVTGGATVTITGTVKGGSATLGYGLFVNNANAIIILNGQVEASSGGAGAYLIGPTSVRAKGPFVHHSGTSRAPIVATHFAVNAGQNTTWTVMNDTAYPAGSPVTLTNYVSNSPAPANVRKGTVYGPGSDVVGTAEVPAAANVRYGVAVDATTGTAAVSVPDVAQIVGAEIAAAVTQ